MHTPKKARQNPAFASRFRAFFGAFGLLFLAGCQSLSPSNPAKVIELGRDNIITSSRLSLFTDSVLISSGHNTENCLADFQTCLTAIDATLLDHDSKTYLAVLAELHYAHAMHLKADTACQPPARPPIDPYYANAPKSDSELDAENTARLTCQSGHLDSLYHALRYSYAYMFYEALTGKKTTDTIISEERLRTQDIYHVTLSALIDELYLEDAGSFSTAHIQHATPAAINDSTDAQVRISTIHLDRPDIALHLYLANHPSYLSPLNEGNHALSSLRSIYNSDISALNVTNMRSGMGVGYVGSLDNRHLLNIKTALTESPSDKSRIHPMGHLLMTTVIAPEGDSLDAVLNSKNFHAYFFNPYDQKTVTLLGQTEPLFANFSAAYVEWLKENQFRELALAKLFSKEGERLPELFMLEPYNPNKKVIIMLHGLASSPRTWVELTNNLFADPVLRDQYQVWQVFYATNLPILENRYHIQSLINEAFFATDPDGTHPASRHAVIISHSMGAVISRLMLSDDNLLNPLAEIAEDKSGLSRLLSTTHQDTIKSRLQLSALPQVDTAVFVSAPFRGTDYADRWFTRGVRRVIQLPVSLTQSVTHALIDSDVEKDPLAALYLQNGASQLSDKSIFMQLTRDVQIKDGIHYHSIMANNTKHPTADTVSDFISDGIVPYTSSHLPKADSEIVITGGHSIHENPQTILHLRKILHDHLKKSP